MKYKGGKLKLHNKTFESAYICLEGLKGAGKTTLFNLLVSRLKETDIDFSTVSPTRSSGNDYFVERLFLKFPSLKNRRFARIFLYAHRSNYASENADWNRRLILGERSLTTSYATKWSESSFLTWLNIGIINLLENKIKTPDYVIYIDVPHDILRDRIKKRDKERDMDDTDTRLKQMEKAYFQMMDNCKIKRISNVKWVKISGIGDPETIADKVYELVNQLAAVETNDTNVV